MIVGGTAATFSLASKRFASWLRTLIIRDTATITLLISVPLANSFPGGIIVVHYGICRSSMDYLDWQVPVVVSERKILGLVLSHVAVAVIGIVDRVLLTQIPQLVSVR